MSEQNQPSKARQAAPLIIKLIAIIVVAVLVYKFGSSIIDGFSDEKTQEHELSESAQKAIDAVNGFVDSSTETLDELKEDVHNVGEGAYNVLTTVDDALDEIQDAYNEATGN